MRGTSERIAVYVDLENLAYGEAGARAEAAELLGRQLAVLARRGTIVACVASCDGGLARRTAFALRGLGVRVFPHAGGPDAADRDLIARIAWGLPATARTVVIVSGDHAFAPVARALRATGRRVEVLARAGTLSHELARAADSVELLGVPLATAS